MQENPAALFRVWGQDNIAYGPLDLPALADWIRRGRVTRTSWTFVEQKGEWVRAGDLTEVKSLFKSKLSPEASASSHGITPGSLRRIRILADMDECQLGSLLQYMEVIKLLPNAIVCRKGEHGDAMFLVLEGEVRARVMVGGQESTLATMTVGECFGEMALVDEGPRSADVLANTESVLLKISATALKRLFHEAPALAAPFLLGLSKTISTRVRRMTKRYEDSILFARTASRAS
jgi:hypothetical protein